MSFFIFRVKNHLKSIDSISGNQYNQIYTQIYLGDEHCLVGSCKGRNLKRTNSGELGHTKENITIKERC